MNDEQSGDVTETTVDLHPGETITPSQQAPMVIQPTAVPQQPAAAPPAQPVATPPSVPQSAPAQVQPVAQPAVQAAPNPAPAPATQQPVATLLAPEPVPLPQQAPVEAPEAPAVSAAELDAQAAGMVTEMPGREGITWRAAEFVAHQKSAAWYLKLAGATLALAALLYLLTRDKVTTGVTILAGLALGAYAGRQPRQLEYALDDQGVSIGNRFLEYEQFKSFAVVDEGPLSSLVLLPLKRFGQLTTLYFEHDYEPHILEILSNYLPIEDRSQDLVDRFMRRIRF